MHEHPTQALLDAFTMRQHKGRIRGLKVAIVGDLLHSRVLRSNLLLLSKMGAEVWVCGPPTLVPPGIDRLGARVTTSVDEAVEGADVIMLLRIQLERMQGGFFPSVREYFSVFGMTEARVRRAKPDVIVMHPGPMNRGVEIASEVADGRVLRDPRAGGKRGGGADGGALPAGGRRGWRSGCLRAGGSWTRLRVTMATSTCSSSTTTSSPWDATWR